MPRKNSVAQLVGFILLALVIVIASVASTLYLADIPMGDFTQRVGRTLGMHYAHTTMTDAQLLCKDKVYRKFDGRVRNMYFDNRSSRLDKEADLFKIFIEMDIYADSDREGSPREMFVSCFVYTDRLAMERFQYAGDSEPDSGIRTQDDSGYFGL